MGAALHAGEIPQFQTRKPPPQASLYQSSERCFAGPCHQFLESWYAALHGGRRSPANWRAILLCSMVRAGATLQVRYTNWLPAQSGTRTTSAPAQKTILPVAFGQETAEEEQTLPELPSLSAKPTGRRWNFPGGCAAATLPRTPAGRATSPGLPAMNALLRRKSPPPLPPALPG